MQNLVAGWGGGGEQLKSIMVFSKVACGALVRFSLALKSSAFAKLFFARKGWLVTGPSSFCRNTTIYNYFDNN